MFNAEQGCGGWKVWSYVCKDPCVSPAAPGQFPSLSCGFWRVTFADDQGRVHLSQTESYREHPHRLQSSFIGQCQNVGPETQGSRSTVGDPLQVALVLILVDGG